jgi:cellulose synthase/poly-beta-1,6-N-acetylglucosamine synthase-like glycosyltransferase
VALEVSVVIPARDEAGAIGACLAALARQSIGPAALDVIVVAAGTDDTEGVARRASSEMGFGRFVAVRIERGNKNAALRAGCAVATAPVVVMLDADTDLADDAVEELARAVREGPERAVHGAPVPRYQSWISRYWELNRLLHKELRFDGMLSGEFVAMRRATIERLGGDALFPELPNLKADFHLARTLASLGVATGYVPSARGTTFVPWTFRGLTRTMLRSRRGTLSIASRADAWAQAAMSAMLVGGLPAALLVMHRSRMLAFVCMAPLLAYTMRLWQGVEALRRQGCGDHRRELAPFLVLDLTGRAIKLWTFVERVTGRTPPLAFRGERPGEAGASGAPTRGASS